MKNLEELRQYLVTFAKDRDWQQFQSPKNLSMALSVEASEIVEHFQWLSEAESEQLSADKKQQVAEEIADVQMYLVLLADRLGVDILQTVKIKSQKNAEKYPVEKVRGSAKKYSEYDSK